MPGTVPDPGYRRVLVRRRTPRLFPGLAGLLAALLLAGCTARSGAGAPTPTAQLAPASAAASAAAGPPSPAVPPRRPPRLSADALAGLRSHTVAWTAGGVLRTVPGTAPAAGVGRRVRVRVEVEKGLDVDRAAFARFVLGTLNDRRSWRHDGYRFARVSGAYDVRVVLASPATSAALCRPLQTFGKLSCGRGTTAVLTTYRWVRATPEYRGDRTGYRHYVVNHEVGHTLGHGHRTCAGPHRRAPVMMQQTKGLRGCRPNPWPYP